MFGYVPKVCRSVYDSFTGSMLPQSSTDYDLQLQNAVRELDSLGKDLGTDTFFLYCSANVPAEGQNCVSPKQVMKDLHNEGLKW